MNHSTPGLPVHHQLLESTQTYVHWVSDAIQPSHPLSSPSPPALNLSQHQGLFKWVSSSHQVAKESIGVSASASVLLKIIQGWFPLGYTGWSPCYLRDSQQSPPAPQFKRINSVLSLLYGPTFTSVHNYWKNHGFDCTDLCGKMMSLLFNTLSRFFIAFFPRSKHFFFKFRCWSHHLQWFWSPRKENLSLLTLFQWWDWMPWS